MLLENQKTQQNNKLQSGTVHSGNKRTDNKNKRQIKIKSIKNINQNIQRNYLSKTKHENKQIKINKKQTKTQKSKIPANLQKLSISQQ